MVLRAEPEEDPVEGEGPTDEYDEYVRTQFGPVSSNPTSVALLPFEKPLIELERRIIEAKANAKKKGVPLTPASRELIQRHNQLCEDTYRKLTPTQRVQLARHPGRPTFLDIAYNITESFMELHGDRGGMNDGAISCGIGTIDGASYMFIGQQKGRNTKENIARNFAMPHPNGYRKALRFMRYADKFGMPIITFVDTPGAFAGMKAEELGQGEAIARNLREMFGFRVPIVSIVIGEGGSGGALAIGCANRSMMMENSVYYVASPEACAAILWKNKNEIETATSALRVTPKDLVSFGIMDKIIYEPSGGAHRDPMGTFPIIKKEILDAFAEYEGKTEAEIVTDRYNKFRKIGVFRDYIVDAGDWRTADARKAAAMAPGPTEYSDDAVGRRNRILDDNEAAYWKKFHEMSEEWDESMEDDEFANPPEKYELRGPTPKRKNIASNIPAKI